MGRVSKLVGGGRVLDIGEGRVGHRGEGLDMGEGRGLHIEGEGVSPYHGMFLRPQRGTYR